MEDMTIEEFRRSRGRVLKQSETEAQVVRDEEGIVMVVGSEGDAVFAEPDDDDEGPLVDEKTVSLPSPAASESGYFSSR
jgi:hypothetical protein